MTHVTYSKLRQNLAHYLDEATESRIPIVVTRQGGKGNVVMMSEEDFSGWQEIVHLMRSPAYAERLRRSISSADAGRTEQRELVPAKPPAEE